ncbi:MAG TPA: DNA alkylation repair protein [Steroidobacteraceae bacterium]|nr:DNA alkylation repair protein [Steroidobacteraceae bacterium]
MRQALRRFASPTRAAGVARFFKTGKGEYGEGDRFMGLTVGEQRLVVREFRALPLEEADKLLTSKYHEERLTALLILVHQFNAAPDDAVRAKIFRLYLKRLPHVNNWDLLDSSADPIVGGWLADKDRGLLDRFAVSKHLWTRRVAIIATFYFIKGGEARDTLRIAEALLNDRHDLIQKAVGWMLREVGKRVHPDILRAFLRRHASAMPRTALRYAIERFPPSERREWLQMKHPAKSQSSRSAAGRL